ncbi:MAG: DNA-protecting protein DprA [Thermoleophilaceae bacterium]|nr:DNA-protecting protein DprA [Thermoleophilaceae bacterium]
MLAPGIASALDDREKRKAGLLSLPDDELIDAVGAQRRARAERFLSEFDADAVRAEVEAAGLGAVCRHDPRFPAQVLELEDAPSVLFHTGDLARLAELASRPVVTIVGARRASPYGLELAVTLGRGAALAGATVVSGLALGIDAAAHRGALDAGGGAIAVLGCGADVPYPARHRPLYERVARTGTVLAELPPGTPPYRWAFPARNRIMAALGKLTVVVEARSSSGTLITADFASDLNRDLGAVPGCVTSPLADGPNALLREGRAGLIRGVEDLLDELLGPGERPPGWDPAGRAQRVADLALFEQGVLRAVEEGLSVAAIAEACDASARDVRAALARLELADLVRSNGLGAYEPTST